ncbi:surface carbohydrate biosynthesis protein [Rhizobium bangladeshense]|uniref:surface carbohydrate biosynthesis protein n=1 Tax=Rhizobium bangladeshense TaxID=1138189 RepID=UPI0007E57905|nr:surface carbohydrate biosynthesis protein [Rhizobium bangladeshense]
MKTTLFLPIDVHVREATAKTLLAATAALSGFNVVIGRKKEVTSIARKYGGGIFLGIGAQANFERQYRDLNSRGVKVVVMDEEGLVTFSDEIYSRTRLSSATLDFIETYFTWGRHHDKVVRNAAPEKLRSSITGNLRFDVLRPELRSVHQRQVQAIKSRLGDYVLIVSSFAACNHFSGTETYLASLRDKKFIQNEAEDAFFRRYIRFKQDVLDAFLAALPAIASSVGDAKVVLRPHPSENVDLWVSAAQQYENIIVEPDGDIQPWIMGSKVIIHHYCTTSIEAFAAGHPAIAFRPFVDHDIETERPYACSLTAHSEAELTKLIHDVLAGIDDLSRKRMDIRHLYEQYVFNTGNETCWQQLISELKKIRVPSSTSVLKFRFDSWRRKRRSPAADVADEYILRKSPHVSLEEMSRTLTDLSAAIPGLKRVKLARLDESCFLVTGS